MSWREKAAWVIADVVGDADPRRLSAEQIKDLRRRLRAAYPFGPRKHYPYKVWCDQVNRALFLKRVKITPPTDTDPDQMVFAFCRKG